MKELRVTWGAESEPIFTGRLSAKEVLFGSPAHRLTGVQGDAVVKPPAPGGGVTALKLTGPTAKFHLPGVEFGLKTKQEPWALELGPDGRLSGKLKVELDNDAGRAEFEFLRNRVRLLAADLDLSRVKGVKERIHEAVIKAIGFKVDMDLDRLRIDTGSSKLTVHLTLKKRVMIDFPKVNEEAKLPIKEEFDLRQAVKDKKIDWKKKVGPAEIRIAAFDLPLVEIRKAIDLDAILGKE